ncbi:hypothetical protein C0Q70_06919 [Pomacea canaliculata]|uniref:carbonic anhydrase n=1 Tax=Pomacea canaliculata TaxID=400727 RepID=A0A2T7PDK8_POMCA|nr:hypothetical protein C0Q70_06919 [Pomacea canaliculata]
MYSRCVLSENPVVPAVPFAVNSVCVPLRFLTIVFGAGPEEWPALYPQCGGRLQSPIDINTSGILYDPSLQPFDLNKYGVYDGAQMNLSNVGGHTAEVKYSGTPIIISGGSLPDDYVLDQFHFHWGEKDDEGSEHTLDKHRAPMELHIVHHMHHYNSSEAISHPYGLAVLAFFFEIGEENENFKQLLDYFPQIIHKDQEVHITPFPLSKLLPKGSTTYYRYFGSLTTPPCYETVIWTLFKDRIQISEDQINKFRNLTTVREDGNGTKEVKIGRDFRPIQELHERRVYSNDVSIQVCATSKGTRDRLTLAAVVTSALLLVLTLC